jgi:DnaJ-class molecular chaperone
VRPLTGRQQRALTQLNDLGARLRADFTVRELRSAFRELARRYHPDRHPGGSRVETARLARMFAEVTESYRQLLAACESPATT